MFGRQFGKSFAVTLGRPDDFHVLPVVSEFLSAIQTSDIGTGQNRRLGAAHCPANGDGKAKTGVPAAKKDVDKLCDHKHPPQPGMVVPCPTVKG